MNKMEKKLEVKNLRIAFRTSNGKVQAVRDISFDLNKGETLAVVGESGSGKSVTTRAVMGILAPNAIVEGGEIIYDGKDLLKIDEEEFHTLRGNRLAMIFQDPLSSLNPIMRIGKQLTEAMLLNNKERRRDAKRRYNTQIRLLESAIVEANNGADKAKTAEKIKKFQRFVDLGRQYETKYDLARETLIEAQGSAEMLLIDMIQGSAKAISGDVKNLLETAQRAKDNYLMPLDSADAYGKRLEPLKRYASEYANRDAAGLTQGLEAFKAMAETILAAEQPNFFRIGYTVMQKSVLDPAKTDIPTINEKALEQLMAEFMTDFLGDVEHAISYSNEKALRAQEQVLPKLKAALPVYEKATLDKSECQNTAKALGKEVAHAIDRLALNKENASYTFSTSMDAAIGFYFAGLEKNPKELKRVERDKVAYDKKVAAGKFAPSVIPANLIDTETAHENMIKSITNLVALYEKNIQRTGKTDIASLAVAMIDYIKEQASDAAYHLSKGMAKHRALSLMKEVGIPDPSKRYRQYPFQMSGGQRQRIVIAIALAADPDILICDEPTTALDVTIQAQILELINSLKVNRQLSVIFITHDLGVVANMADRIAVMYAGKIVEYGNVDDVFYDPCHPYTWALLSSMPDLATKEKLDAIPGTPPNMIIPPIGDAFAARNQYAMQIDFEKQPPFFKVTDTHYAATWLLHPQAPKVSPPAIVRERIARMKKQEAVLDEQ